MMSVQNVKLLLVFLLSTQVLAQELNSTLHSTVYGAPIAYTDEMVIFTCVVRGSNSMAWTSEEYIGTGGQRLELSAAEPVGTRYSAVGNNQTVAELINATIDEIIVSQLRIRIKTSNSVASVRCHNINAGTMTSIDFLLAGATSVTVVCDRQSTCPDERVTCTCTTGNSNTLAWVTNRTRLVFTSNDPLERRYDVDGSSTFAILTNSSDTNGIRVIMSNLTFVASGSMSSVFTCENVDRSTSESVVIPISDFSIMTTLDSCTESSGKVTTPTGGEDTLTRDSCVAPFIAAIVVPVIIFIITTPIIIIVLIVVCLKNSEITGLKGEKKKLNEKLGENKKEIDKLKKDKERLKKKFDKQKQEADRLATENEELDKKLNDAKVKLDEKERELETLKKKGSR